MSRVRSSMILLGICVVALFVGMLRVATEPTPLPTGSSYSTQADGAQALYDWAETVGASASRLRDQALPDDQSSPTLLVLQPETALDSRARDAFDAVPGQGGTLVVAGDSLPWLLYARNLGITVEPIRNGNVSAVTPDGGLTLSVLSRYRVRADAATPLLIAPNGDWMALRMPYKEGSLIVLATPQLLTNAALGDPQTARFVFREVISPAIGHAFIVDEAHHSFAPVVAGGPATFNQLLFETSAGRAVIFAAVLTFVYVLLSGRRLGPALPARPPTETRRTMYEHVQMLANLYRRAGQFAVVRDAFSRRFARLLARGAAGSPQRTAALTAALARVEAARTESELVAAVASAQSYE
jgi:uncharacterized protein DUF4350